MQSLLVEESLLRIQSKVLFNVGNYRINRLIKEIEVGGGNNNQRQTPWHAYDQNVIKIFKLDCKLHWQLEEGFSCAHLTQRQFIISPYPLKNSHWMDYGRNTTVVGKRVLNGQCPYKDGRNMWEIFSPCKNIQE